MYHNKEQALDALSALIILFAELTKRNKEILIQTFDVTDSSELNILVPHLLVGLLGETRTMEILKEAQEYIEESLKIDSVKVN